MLPAINDLVVAPMMTTVKVAHRVMTAGGTVDSADNFGPTLLSLDYPVQRATILSQSPTLTWPKGYDPSGVASYKIQVSKSPNFTTNVVDVASKYRPRSGMRGLQPFNCGREPGAQQSQR